MWPQEQNEMISILKINKEVVEKIKREEIFDCKLKSLTGL